MQPWGCIRESTVTSLNAIVIDKFPTRIFYRILVINQVIRGNIVGGGATRQ